MSAGDPARSIASPLECSDVFPLVVMAPGRSPELTCRLNFWAATSA